MKNWKLNLQRLSIAAMCVLSISFLQSCGSAVPKDDESFISHEDAVYLMIEGQRVNVIGKENVGTEFIVGGDWYLISGARLETILRVFHDLQGRSDETDAIVK